MKAVAAAVEVLGRETTEGRLLGSTAGEAGPAWEEPGTTIEREFEEDLADGRVRESFFMFLRGFGFVGEGRSRLSGSECAETGGLSPRARTMEDCSRAGVSILRNEGASFLRGKAGLGLDEGCMIHASV